MVLTYYDVLRVESTCTVEELRKAYRKMALLFHPDKNSAGLRMFQMVNRAHQVLSDPERRKKYDRKLETRRRAERAPAREKCADTVRRLRVPLSDFYAGGSRILVLERKEPCRRRQCVVVPRKACESCGGRGTVGARRTFRVNVEKGVPDGHRIVFPGRGDCEPGRDPGDLIVELVEIPHPGFRRYGSCVAAEVDLTLEEALCGFQKTIETPDRKKLVMCLMRGMTTPDGTVRYVENHGMPLRPGSSERGRLVLKFKVHWPAFVFDDAIERLSEILRAPRELRHDDTRVYPRCIDRRSLSLYERMFAKE